MKKIIALVLVGFLSACAIYQNPITANRLATAESVYGVALSAAVAYRKLCADKVIARANCAIVVAQMQAADKKVQAALTNVRAFQREHPEIDAVSLVLALEKAVSDFKFLTDQHDGGA